MGAAEGAGIGRGARQRQTTRAAVADNNGRREKNFLKKTDLGRQIISNGQDPDDCRKFFLKSPLSIFFIYIYI